MKILIDGQTLLTPQIYRGIGTYYKNIVENLLESDFTTEYYINIAHTSQLEHLSAWARKKFNIIVNGAYHPQTHDALSTEYRSRAYSDALNTDLQNERIDIYWSPNALMDNVFLPSKGCSCKFAATIHDLIILVLGKMYSNKWPRSAMDTYHSKLRILERDYDLYLHVSKHTETDFRRNLKVEKKRHIVTLHAAGSLFRPSPFPKIYSPREYVLYVGGFDPRKNMERAIEAFAYLRKRYAFDEKIRRTELLIVCDFDRSEKDRLLERASNLRVENKVVLTGHVDDCELVSLYQKAQCLFFPSLYEGFGLPLLEALACGLPVAASNVSSLPEIGGNYVTYFDPYKIKDMAGALYSVLCEPMDYASRMKRYAYSRKFSWRETALDILSAFENLPSPDASMNQ